MIFKCKHCYQEFDCDEENYEETLWGRLQMIHEKIFNEYQNYDTPYMIENNYEKMINMKKYSSAVEDYFQNVIKNSWTWDRLTSDEQDRFTNMDVFDEIKGTDKIRVEWLYTIYKSFLIALGYKQLGWRDTDGKDTKFTEENI